MFSKITVKMQALLMRRAFLKSENHFGPVAGNADKSPQIEIRLSLKIGRAVIDFYKGECNNKLNFYEQMRH